MLRLSLLTIALVFLSSCAMQVRPIGGVSQDELEAQARQIEQALNILNKRLIAVESLRDEKTK